MLDDFFVRALLAGIGVALTVGPLGCFVVWRRMAYFGDTMAHSALLGVALSLLAGVSIMLGVLAVAIVTSVSLLFLQRRNGLPSDALLGILSHSTLALGLVLVAAMSWLRVDVMSLLFGDILAVGTEDILIVWIGCLVILGTLKWIWHPLLSATIDEDLAKADGLDTQRANLIFTLLLAVVIALAIKLVGVLLITALLIIPAATARRFALGPGQMAAIAAGIGVLSVVAGLFGSLQFDTPSGPSIVVAAFVIFLLSHGTSLNAGHAK